MQWIPCSMIECSGFYAAWPNGSRLNAVDSMQCGAVDSDWLQCTPCSVVKSGSIAPQCMESSAFNDAAWNPLHSKGMVWAMFQKSTAFIHAAGIHCIQSCCIKSNAFNRVPFLHTAWTSLHSITLHEIHCIRSGCILPRCMDYTAFNDAAWNPLHSIGMLWALLHKIHCIQSGCIGPRCMDSTAFNNTAWNPLHSIGMLLAMLHKIHCIQSCCM